MQSIKTEVPLKVIGIDVISFYPTFLRHRCRYCLIIIEYFSKWVELVPLQRVFAKSVVSAFFNYLISKFGTSLQIIFYNGSQFVTDVFADLCHRLKIEHIRVVLYRPQANMAEKVNRTPVQFILSPGGFTEIGTGTFTSLHMLS